MWKQKSTLFQNKYQSFSKFWVFFWEQQILSLMSQITCVLYQILLAWLFKSCGDRAPIPLKNSEIVNKRNNKKQNVKISGNILVQLIHFLQQLQNFYKEVFKLFSFIVNKRNNKQQNVKISGNVLVQLFRSFCSIYKIFTKKFLNYSVSTREQVFPLKKYHQRWK